MLDRANPEVVAGLEARAIRIAILAMGGEGGGVLAEWIVDLAEHAGYLAQLTSVPGVAQRTGATIYYVELFPKSALPEGAPEPVMALMPMPGDVDIVIASELMEAGRAVQRGLVTPDRTALIASTHRVFAMTEKIAMADGRADAPTLLEACRNSAKNFFGADLAAAAERTGSVISAVLFGALAQSRTLPFERDAFEATIDRAGVGVAASKRGFAAGMAAVSGHAAGAPAGDSGSRASATAQVPAGSPADATTDAPLAALVARAEGAFPASVRPIVRAGLERLADYQDLDYAQDYLLRLKPIADAERRHGDGSGRLLAETARELALGMAYEDTIRVAELKIRASRFTRVRDEVRARDGQIVEIAEFMHPRLKEIAESVPAWLGRLMLRPGIVRSAVENATRKGRVVKTTSIRGFLQLYLVASLKTWRRSSLRFAEEEARLTSWLERIVAIAAKNYALAVELAECRGLVKGYGDTHERGVANYESIIALVDRLAGGPEPAQRLHELRKAAVADDSGSALKAAIAQLGTS
ncbi:MAG: indolepyruvate oxidoreductase subunit beta family protein [Hyphomicrobiales bacterium]|nr:indolepyruvate oxidoreductase subunit beta family protein [Hyphomicrobiales bacterium]